jgi:hypothetical protein
MIVIAINPSKSEALSMALAFILANVVFLPREDIGIIVKDRGADVVLNQPFYDGR